MENPLEISGVSAAAIKTADRSSSLTRSKQPDLASYFRFVCASNPLEKMSLLPLHLARSWWDAVDYPARILDQNFGMGVAEGDLLAPTLYRGFLLRPRTQLNIDKSGKSEVVNDKERFRVSLNLPHFKPEEISVKTVGNSVVVHGKHDEKSDEHGFIAREFTRRYMLPAGTDPETVKSSLTPEGVLVIEAPKKVIEPPPVNERVVPIDVQNTTPAKQ